MAQGTSRVKPLMRSTLSRAGSLLYLGIPVNHRLGRLTGAGHIDDMELRLLVEELILQDESVPAFTGEREIDRRPIARGIHSLAKRSFVRHMRMALAAVDGHLDRPDLEAAAFRACQEQLGLIMLPVPLTKRASILLDDRLIDIHVQNAP